MAHGASTSCPRRFPIAVEVKNEFAKGYGVLPMSITSKFGSQIGRKPTIGAADGQIYSVRFEKTSDGGLLTTGWSIFVQQCNLVTKTKAILQYVGESYFLIKSSYHKQNRSDFDREMDNSSEFSDTPPLMQEIIITPYSAKNHQPLPARFVQSCLNVNLSSITFVEEDGSKWECGLHLPKRKLNEARITVGWNTFCSHLQLKGRNNIFLELLDGQRNLLRVIDMFYCCAELFGY